MEHLHSNENKSDFFIPRDIPMSDEDFKKLSSIVYEKTGIVLTENKKELLYNRVRRRLIALEIKNFSEYYIYLKNHINKELSPFINCVTTNQTSFFREKHHFEFFESSLCPILYNLHKETKRLRIWSAGCSTGEEAYSIALMINKHLLNDHQLDIKVLATDLDTDVLNKAVLGRYPLDRLKSVDSSFKSYFQNESIYDNAWHAEEKLKQLISFKQLNLISQWPMTGKFDVIFCRNVVIYFDKETQKNLFRRFSNILKKGGFLFIGHSESLYNLNDDFTSLGKTIYQKL